MNKDFERWLEHHPAIKEAYQANPESQDDIYKDYQYEVAFEDFDSWLDWALKNEATARKYFPHVMKMMDKVVSRSSVTMSLAAIQKVADEFPIWKAKANELIGPAKRKFIVSQIRLNRLILNNSINWTEVEKETIDRISDEISANMYYWENELSKTTAKPQAELNIGSENERLILEIIDAEGGWSVFFHLEADFRSFLNLLLDFFKGKQADQTVEVIRTKKRTKTKMGNLLGRIHFKLSMKEVQSDIGFLNLVRKIDAFESEKNIAKCLTRNRLS